MPIPKNILSTIRPFVKGSKVVNPRAASKSLLEYRQLALALAKRNADRSALRVVLNKNKLSAIADPKYRKLLSSQMKTYGKEVVSDVAHPISTLKRQTEMVKHHVDPTGKIIKRSPVGSAIVGASLFGLPLYYGGQELADKDPNKSTTEKIVRAAATTIPAALTPKVLPSVAAMSAPDVIYNRPNESPLKKRVNKYVPYEELLEYYTSAMGVL
jgi:hypothetical protein